MVRLKYLLDEWPRHTTIKRYLLSLRDQVRIKLDKIVKVCWRRWSSCKMQLWLGEDDVGLRGTEIGFRKSYYRFENYILKILLTFFGLKNFGKHFIFGLFN